MARAVAINRLHVALLDRFYLIKIYSDQQKHINMSAWCHELCNLARVIAINRHRVALLEFGFDNK